jgi:hypothetical protein
MKGSKYFFFLETFVSDNVLRQRKLPLRDAVALLLAVSLACLPNLIQPMVYGPIESNNDL